MLENINLAFQGVWSHKLRSFLTMLGIIIGIAAIITIVSTIKGTNEQIKQNLIGAGNNVVDVTLMQDNNQIDFSYASVPDGISMITAEMRDEIDKLDKVRESSLYYSRSWADGVYVGNSSFNGSIYGGDSHFLSVGGYAVNYGRGFIDSDFTTCRKVALLDANTAQSLFQGLNPIGGTVEIQGEPFVVVGVISQKSTSEPVINSVSDYYMYSGNTSGTIIIPNTCWPIVYRYDEPASVAVRATSTNDMTEAGNNVAQYLNDNVVSTDKYKYQAKDLLQQAADLQSLSETTNKQLIWIAAISLVVGGIGVMNIMLVSVTERTREIGIRKSLGAKTKVITLQFLTESVILCLIGGIIGLVLGIAGAYAACAVINITPKITWWVILLALAFSSGVGLFFGIYPARKAAKLSPIEALRRE